MKKEALLFLMIIILIGVLLFSFKNKGDASENFNESIENITEPTDLYDCINNSDCIVIGTKPGCCSCDYEPVAINKKYESYWKQKNPINCICLEDASCNLEAGCLDNKCVVKK